MAGRRKYGGGRGDEPDLFASSPDPEVRFALSRDRWPDAQDFPVNHVSAKVSTSVWADLASSANPLVVAGFTSIGKIIELVAGFSGRPDPARVRVLLGTEPFASDRLSFGSASDSFTEEVRQHWIEERGVSLLLSAKVVQVIQALDAGWFQVRFVPGRTRLHAKIYLGDGAVTIGSSNFTAAGLHSQFEANVRFRKRDDSDRYAGARTVAENYWDVGVTWNDELRALLHDMLRFVSWREALARACADLLEGQWASRYLTAATAGGQLWPSQVAGIAEALWVVENVGSVLVADATGSGKTRMGAHLTRAVRDRLWSTGRARGDLTVLVCPPAVERQWLAESLSCGLTLRTVSHGLLSRPGTSGPRMEEREVAAAQVLAIDEAHNFLSTRSNRTELVRRSGADHVLMFTATPINRGAQDLLSLVDLLGADNFDDATLSVLDQLSRRGHQPALGEKEKDLIRREIQRFTVRRTKTVLNAMVDQDPEPYRHPDSGRVCRYPEHVMKSYPTRETRADEQIAHEIREHAKDLTGIALLGANLNVPPGLRREYDDKRWLDLRLGAASGLASHHVRSAMRSSRAALLEHVAGTEQAIATLAITNLHKPQSSGNMIATVEAAIHTGRPTAQLNCPLPDWLTDADAWRAQCELEANLYRAIAALATQLSDSRERAKAHQVADLAKRHPRVLAFDRHPITLAVLENLLGAAPAPVLTATGATGAARRRVQQQFGRDATGTGIALCSDAMNEGINLQGASAILHFDMPTTLRVAEQRVGRVDRMDSPYERIEVWWPDDGPAFATHADELLAARNAESSELLGSNLPIPSLHHDDSVVDKTVFARAEDVTPWDGLRDALDPVRQLVTGPRSLLPAAIYDEHRNSRARVLSRISPVRSTTPWAFFAITGTRHGAPRWLLLEGTAAPIVGLENVAERLRELLEPDPPECALDEEGQRALAHFIDRAHHAETQLLPRRDQRALAQMVTSCRTWAAAATRAGDYDAAGRWHALGRVAEPEDYEEASADLHRVADAWWHLTRTQREEFRSTHRRRRYTTLSDIDETLRLNPLSLGAVEGALMSLPLVEPLDLRISACILGVPSV
ncbi:RNA polymerase-associated protein RapA [mine drainage metagenome]|uniref:RNA polymerase-associated protein RapA n=1 Tax=mine drainage metagenome TaxID=410659 RepID=A0A1J5R117_9ZZZZ